MKYTIILFALFLAFSPLHSQIGEEEDLTDLLILGDTLTNQLYRLDVSLLNELFDEDSLLHDAIGSVEGEGGEVEAFKDGFREGFRNKFQFGNLLLPELQKGINYDFISYYQAGPNEYHILFRLFSEDGLNYHDYKLFKDENGYRIRDVYFYITAEEYSETIRKIYYSTLAGLQSEMTFDTESSKLIEGLKKVGDIRIAMMNQEFQKAYDLFDEIPFEIANQKTFQALKVQIAYQLDDQLYFESMDKYINAFPGDPSIYLVSIDKYIMTEEYDQAMSMVDTLDMIVFGDEFLDLYRGNISYLKGDILNAEKYFARLVEYFPSYLEGYDSLLLLYIQMGKNENAVHILETMKNLFGMDKGELGQFIELNYPDFSKTDEFVGWKSKE